MCDRCAFLCFQRSVANIYEGGKLNLLSLLQLWNLSLHLYLEKIQEGACVCQVCVRVYHVARMRMRLGCSCV